MRSLQASNTKDVVVKKMVYLFLCNYAVQHAELTLLAINTLQKDCRDEDPMIRGLALRSLCSLRLDSIIEYVMTPLQNSLTDSSAYVRATGVIGILKVFHLQPEVIKDSDLVDTVYNMIRDRDAQVVVNCILALNELMADEGGVAINQAIIHHLLNRIRDFNEWGQCTVLALVARYTPATQEEMFGIMNLLDVCLKTSNSAVVLAATKCFLNLTDGLPELRPQVYLRLKTPLLTLMASASPEVAYCVLGHVLLLVKRAPGVFDDEFKQFFCRYHEPTCVKHIKMDCMPYVANPSNTNEIVAELIEYVSDVDADMARHAIRAVAEIAVRVPGAADRVVASLLELLDLDVDYVKAETMVAMRDILRKYPTRAADVLPTLQRCLHSIEEPQGKAAVVWMIGEFGQIIDEGPYLLEALIDGLEEDQEALVVRLELLTSTTKLFFKRPPEVQKMLGRLLKTCLADGSPACLRDKALLYYRLLSQDATAASTVVGGATEPVVRFLEEEPDEGELQVFREFNSLSVIYGKPEEQFVTEDHRFVLKGAEAAEKAATVAAAVDAVAAAAGGAGAGAGAGAVATDTAAAPVPEGVAPPPAGAAAAPFAAAPAPAPAAPSPSADDLLGLDDDLLGGFGSPAPAPAPAPAPVAAPVAPPFSLAAGVVITPQDFQAKWAAWPAAATPAITMRQAPTEAALTAALRAVNVNIVASGEQGDTVKCYAYATATSGGLFLLELIGSKTSTSTSATIKTDKPADVPQLQQLLASVGASL